MKKEMILVGVIALIVGAGGGYALAEVKSEKPDAERMQHMMPNGQMMNDKPAAMNMQGEMDSMMAGLQGKTGDAFDQEFLSEMIVHHQGAVQMAQAALQSAKHQEIKDLAQNIITAQNKEIAEMQAWQKTWYGK